jgi:hypothetical protein
MKDNTIKFFLGVIAFCLCGLLIKETAKSVQAQSQPGNMTAGQSQIAAGDGKVYVLIDRKMYVYSWENDKVKEMTKQFGPIKLKRTEVIDVNPAPR